MSEKDRLVLAATLESLEKVQVFSGDFAGVDEFYADVRSFDAVLMNFVIIGEMIARLSDDFIDRNNRIEWHKIRGFRNIVAHNYFGVDAEEVWQIIKNDIPDLKEQIESLLANK